MMESLILKLDNFANSFFKESIIFKYSKSLKEFLSLKFGNDKLSKFFFYTTLLLILSIFTCLALPQFSSDRFGIGILILLTFSCFIFLIITTKDINISFNMQDLCIVCLLLIGSVSTFSSYFFKESLIGFIKYIIFILFYLISKVLIQNQKINLQFIFLNYLFFLGTILSIHGIYQYVIGVEPLATWDDPTLDLQITRVYSTMGNPNLLAGFLLLVFPLGLVLPFCKKHSLKIYLLYFLCNAVIFLSILFTGSRGAYLALAAIFVIIFFVLLIKFGLSQILPKLALSNFYMRIFGTLFLISITILIFTLGPDILERFSTIFNTREHSSNNFRINVWISSIKMFMDNFLTGIGPGNTTFRLVYGLYMKTGFDALSAYNIFLEIAVELGIIGFILLISLFMSIFIKLHYYFYYKKNILALGLVLVLVSLLIQGLFDTVFFRPQILIPSWFLLSIIDKLEYRKEE